MNKVRNIYVNVFEESKKDEKKRMEVEQKIKANPSYKQVLNDLDPYLELEKNDIKLDNEAQFASFHDEIVEKINNLQLGSLPNSDDDNKKEQIVAQLNNKFNLKKVLEQTETRKQRITHYLDYFEKQIQQTNQDLADCHQQKQQVLSITKIADLHQKSRLDIEIQIRLKQGIVEVSQQKPIQEEEVVLVQRDVIENKNQDIMTQGKFFFFITFIQLSFLLFTIIFTIF